MTLPADNNGGRNKRRRECFLRLFLSPLLSWRQTVKLKAHVCRHTQDVPPRIHNLVRLAALAELSLISTQSATLAEINAFNLKGRYPDMLAPPPKQKETAALMDRAGEMLQWLVQTLP